MRSVAGGAVAAFVSALSMSALLPIDALAQTGAEKAEAQLETVEDVAGLTDLSFDELRGRDLSGVNDTMMRPAPSAPRQPLTRAEREAATIRGMTEGQGIRGHTVIPDTLNRDAAAFSFAQERMQDAAAAEARSYSFGDKFGAAFADRTFAAALIRRFGRERAPLDMDWMRAYSSNRRQLEEGYSWPEVQLLRQANSQTDFDRIADEIAKGRERKAIYMSGGGQGISIFAHMLDPVVWLALVALWSASMVVVRSRRRLGVPAGN